MESVRDVLDAFVLRRRHLSKSDNCQNTLSRRQHTIARFEDGDTYLSDLDRENQFQTSDAVPSTRKDSELFF